MCLVRFADLSHITVYGTSCATWDMVPETPWYGRLAQALLGPCSALVFHVTILLSLTGREPETVMLLVMPVPG